MMDDNNEPGDKETIKVAPGDPKMGPYMFDLLLGDNLQDRKEFIAENGHKYLKY